MNKKKAIKIIEIQIEKLKEFKEPKNFDYNWKSQTMTYIENFFGSDSTEFNSIKNIQGSGPYATSPIPLLKNCIELIRNLGLYKKPKQNFLYSMPNWLAMLLFPLMLTIGITIGNFQAKSQMNDTNDNKSGIISNTTSGVSKPISDSIPDNKHNSE